MTEKVDLDTAEARKSLAKMTLKLFRLWDLSEIDQLSLLGLSPSSQAALVRFAEGEVMPESRNLLDIISRLLQIHKNLRLLFPYNRDLCYAWVTQPNGDFDDRTPLDIMKDEGLEGIVRIAHHLNKILSR